MDSSGLMFQSKQEEIKQSLNKQQEMLQNTQKQIQEHQENALFFNGSEMVKEKEAEPYEKGLYDFQYELGKDLTEEMKTFGASVSVDKYKKRSGSACDFINCLLEWRDIIEVDEQHVPASKRLEKLFRLAQTSQSYALSHNDKLIVWTQSGRDRIKIANKIHELASSYAITMLSDEEKEKLRDNSDADTDVGETPKLVLKKLQKAASAYQKYNTKLAGSSLGYMPGEEVLKRKLKAFKANERLIKLYRKYKEKEDPDVEAYVKEYEQCRAWEILLKKTGIKEESLEEVIEDHLVEEGEIEKVKEEEKFKSEDSKEALTLEQRKGVEEIDNWLLRNFDNGVNNDADMVNSLLSMSKRERLHVYYLVEKERRRTASVADVWLSQAYAPDLKTFKKKILANKAMFWKRLTGDYTYSYKLSEAMQVSKSYRKDLKAAGDMASGGKVETKDRKKLSEKDQERLKQLTEFNGYLQSYNAALIALSSAKTDAEKTRLKEVVERERLQCMDKSAELLAKYKRGNTHVDEGDGTAFKVEEGSQLMGFLGNLPNTFKQDFANGAPQIVTSAVTGMIGVVTGTIMLTQNWSVYSDEERAERTLGLGSSILNASAGIIGMASMIAKTSQAVMGAATAMGTYAPVLGVALSGGMAIAQGVGAVKMKVYSNKASKFFEKKRELSKIGMQKNAELMDEKQKKLEQQKRRELKYEENLLKLQKDLNKRQGEKTAFTGAGAGLAGASIAFPPLAIVALGVGVAGLIRDFKRVENLRTALFDRFFNLDGLTEKVVRQRFKDSRIYPEDSHKNEVKQALRLRVAAKAGFNSVKTASVFICSKFARLIREKLFNSDNTGKEEKAAYINLVKSLNLRYNEKKQLPDENILVRKMTGR